MAEADIGQVFQDLATQLRQVSTAVGTQGVGQVVQKFDGSTKEYKSWIKSIEKYATLTGLDDERKKMVCYQTAVGPVSDFIHRFMNENQDCAWGVLKTALSTRFSEVQDAQHATYLLRNIKQNLGENVHTYVERLLTLAEDVFQVQAHGPQQAANLAVIERQLIEYFIDGLSENFLKLKVMRDAPVTLQAAVTSATNEQNLRTRFNLRFNTPDAYQNSSRHENMEVDHIRPQKRCQFCNRQGHSIKDCRTRQRRGVNEVHAINNELSQRQNGRYNQSNQSYSYSNWKSKMLCFNCNKPGHFYRECRDFRRNRLTYVPTARKSLN